MCIYIYIHIANLITLVAPQPDLARGKSSKRKDTAGVQSKMGASPNPASSLM